MSSKETASTDSPPGSNSKDNMFEPKPKPKMIRVLTVLAYVLSVSMAAILLSIYYIFMWEGTPHLGARKSNNREMGLHNHTNRDVGPVLSRHIAYQDELNISKRENLLNLTQDQNVPLTEPSLIIGNVTEDYYEQEVNTTNTDNTTESRYRRELQQQITAVESDESIISSTLPTTTTEEIGVTWLDDYDEKSIFFRKVMGSYY